MCGRGSDLTTTLVYPLLGLKVSVLTPVQWGATSPTVCWGKRPPPKVFDHQLGSASQQRGNHDALNDLRKFAPA